MNRIYKFTDITEMQLFLNGAIIGGNIAQGAAGLIGLTLTFTSPAFAVTFTAVTPPPATRDSYSLMLCDIKAQVEAVNPAILVTQVGGKIIFAEKVPTSGVALSANNEAAKAILGFDRSAAVVGRLYRPPDVSGDGPSYVAAYSISESNHVIIAWE